MLRLDLYDLKAFQGSLEEFTREQVQLNEWNTLIIVFRGGKAQE